MDPLQHTPIQNLRKYPPPPGHAFYTYCFCFCTWMCSSLAASLSLFIATCASLKKEYKKSRFLIPRSKFTGKTETINKEFLTGMLIDPL